MLKFFSKNGIVFNIYTQNLRYKQISANGIFFNSMIFVEGQYEGEGGRRTKPQKLS